MAKCKFTISFLFLLFFLTFIISFAYAQRIEVHSGNSIQEAINQAVSGDTVLVYVGTYSEDITMKDGVDLEGESYARVTIEGRVFFKDANCALRNVTVLFPETGYLSYDNSYYSGWKLEADTGITAINSAPTIQNCVIKPDLEFIPLQHYGKAIQIWNMYNHPDTTPRIEGNLIRDTNCGIYYFSQASGGAIEGEIKNNIFYNNKIGVFLRMHRENPRIYNNIFHSCVENVIHYTYRGETLFSDRKNALNNNLLWNYSIKGWLDESRLDFSIAGFNNNIAEDPEFIDLEDDSFYLSKTSHCIGAGEGGADIGAYPTDLRDPVIEYILPAENKFVGQELIDISGSVDDDNGIFSVYIDSYPAIISDMCFLKENYPLDYGLNNINIIATDLAKKSTSESITIYLFRAPVEPPQE